MPTTVALTNSNSTVWSFASTDTPSNTALAGRMHDLGFLVEGSSSPFAIARPGVLASAGQGASNTVPGGLYVSPTGTGLNVQMAPGCGVIERGTFSGATWSSFTPAGTYPYAVAVKSTLTFAANAANSLSGTRIDRVDLQIMDGPGQGDNGGTSLGQLIYTAGTVGSGVAANAPANSIPLSVITFPSGTTTTLTSGMFTDMRRGAGVRGSARVLLPGDALSDAGFMAGEERMRYHATYGWLSDIWDPTGPAWRGTKMIAGVTPAWANGTSNITISSSSRTTLVTVSIPDPGWSYKIDASAQIDWTGYGSFTAGGAPFCQGFITLGSNTGTLVVQSNGFAQSSNGLLDSFTVVPSQSSAVLSGAQTVYLSGLTSVGGGVTCGYATFSTAISTYLNVTIIPA